MTYAQTLSTEFHVQPWQAEAVIRLLDEGNTLPFIARYRKEQHGELNDQVLRDISLRLEQLRTLQKRREEILSSLEKQGVLTEELQRAVGEAETAGALEDIYRPYRPKRRTRATIARERGLEPLANILLMQSLKSGSAEDLAAPYVSEEKGVADTEAALAGAMDILAEDISNDANIRTRLKELYQRTCQVKVKAAKEEDSVYRMYYDHQELMRLMPSHRVLAMNRGEAEGFLKVSLAVEEIDAIGEVARPYVRHGSITTPYVQQAAEDSYRRLIAPSLENELRGDITNRAQEAAVKVFAQNLKPLLMQPPVRGKAAIGLDPGIRTGCKTAVVDETGRVLDTAVIYPLPSHGRVEQAKDTVKKLIRKHRIQVAAIGNGTASRETEEFFVSVLHDLPGENLSYMVVSEAGASVYSASPLAAKEFPQFDVSLRSAVSIARRLQDPLAELVKIDPKSIGVGQYQHEVKEAELDAALSGVVEDCVNAVGVDVNTASPSLLSHISGINSAVAQNIVTYREENGPFPTRAGLKKVPKLGPKAFEQCAGFLRIPGGKNPLENTGVHPESYEAAEALLKLAGLSVRTAPGSLTKKVEELGFDQTARQLGIGLPTLKDIVKELEKPGRDPRDELPPPLMRSDVLSLEDLKPGMELNGTVRNVADFGAFVDIGVHRDGLVHVSQLSRRRVNHPGEAVKVGDVVKVWVVSVEKEKNRISLTMIPPAEKK